MTLAEQTVDRGRTFDLPPSQVPLPEPELRLSPPLLEQVAPPARRLLLFGCQTP